MPSTVVFFDIGDTLATPVFEADRLILNLLPGAREALESLRARNIRTGVISYAGDEPDAGEKVNDALRDCGLFDFFAPSLMVYRKKDSPAPFIYAAGQANVPPDQCVFVGENSQERSFALQAGFLRVAPHPILVIDVIEGASLFYARIQIPNGVENQRWRKTLLDLPIAPLHVTKDPGISVYVITTIKTIDSVREAELDVEALGKRDAPLETDLYIVRDDRAKPQGFMAAREFSTRFLAERGQFGLIVGASAEGLYLALPTGVSIDQIPHFPAARHGHNERLLPDMTLLNPFVEGGAFVAPRGFTATAAAEPDLSQVELDAIAQITAGLIRKHHEPYIGAPPNFQVSRHIKHPDNRRFTEMLRDHFREIGGPDIIIRLHRFQHENLYLNNIEAELPGSDPGSLVLVTAHLDSTAAFNPGGVYHPTSDPAPGSDDDASGMAAVLAIAETLANLRALNRPKRTLRFVLFNAEEQGMIGSKAYARNQAAQSANITAVFQMDMIGYRKAGASPFEFEVHVGYPPDRNVEDRSFVLGRLIQSVVARVSPSLSLPQIYPNREEDGDDPAAGRSDHGSFHERGYASCVLSEDFFVGPRADSPTATPNPNYHQSADRAIDYEYAAAIARAVGAGALLAANIAN